MEYPGIIFCGWRLHNSELFSISDHEIGHTWFPMLVGSNERKYAWMDEGFNSFLNILSDSAFNNGEYHVHATWNRKTLAMFSAIRETPMTLPDVLQVDNLSNEAYDRPAMALYLLRRTVLGPLKFDQAFKSYAQTWALKHPSPDDFFHIMENESGEDLGWFWREWFFNNWQLDQAISSFGYIEGNPEKGSLITFENRGKMIMPLDIEIKYKHKRPEHIHLPIEIWQRGNVIEYHLYSKSRIDQIIIDPEHIYPDVNTDNNILKVDP